MQTSLTGLRVLLRPWRADDAEAAEWFRLDELPELAFDHAEILKRAAGRIAERYG